MSTDLAPKVVSPAEWLEARKKLLVKEKEVTRLTASVAAERRSLPMVEVTKPYIFTGPHGRVNLLDMFEGRKQLIIYHFMFEPDNDEGCSSCSVVADNIPHLSHLNSRNTTFVLVSRAPIEKIEAFKKRMGWTVPWYSSFGQEFNYDFHVTTDESVRSVEYNYDDKETLERKGLTWFMKGEQPGLSVFLQKDGKLYHTYSTYAVGGDAMIATYVLLDMTPMGRQEAGKGGIQHFRHHDKYDEDD